MRRISVLKKCIIAAICAICLFVAAFLVTWIPHTVDRTLSAVRYRTDGILNPLDMTIIMNGKLSTPWFFSPRFSGTIQIEGYPQTFDYDTFDITLMPQANKTYTGSLIYGGIENGEARLDMFGFISTTKTMDEICIMIPEPIGAETSSYDDEHGLVIVAPATVGDLEDAQAIKERLYP